MISERYLKSTLIHTKNLITAIHKLNYFHDLFCKKMDFIHYLVLIHFFLLEPLMFFSN
jgi:hypothetical protein